MSQSTFFVADGRQRARKALLPIVRAEVEAEYAERLQKASLVVRLLLRQEMRSEIERRVQIKAPQDALY